MRANRRVSSSVFLFISFIMFVISYFNESLAEWTGTGSGGFTDIEDARKYMRKLSEECNRCVSFKIIKLPAS